MWLIKNKSKLTVELNSLPFWVLESWDHDHFRERLGGSFGPLLPLNKSLHQQENNENFVLFQPD